MVDFEKVLFEYLDSSSPFKTLIGNNLYCDQVYGFDGHTQKGCMFRFRTGSSNEFIPIHDILCDFHVFGGSDTPEDSRAVYRALHDRLHAISNVDTSSGFIINAKESVCGQTLVEPHTGWYKVFVTYSITIR